MISYLRGQILSKSTPHVVIDAGGVGYEVETTLTTYLQLPEVRAQVELFIHFQPREDAITLYGFSHTTERDLFRRLLKISGIGPKAALAILSSTTPDQFVLNIMANDVSTLTRIPGIGKKTAERLILEMKDSLQDWVNTSLVQLPNATDKVVPKAKQQYELLEALQALGYKRPEAMQMLRNVQFNESTSLEHLLKEVLQHATVKG